MFCAAVFGLVILGFVFGSSSASADEGGPDTDGLVPVVAGGAGGVVEPVAPVTAAVTDVIPLVDVPLSPATHTVETVTAIAPLAADVLASTPAGPLVGTVAKTIDTTIGTALGTLTDTLTTVTHPGAATAPPGIAVAAAHLAPAAAFASGLADDAQPDQRDPIGTGGIASGATGSSFALPAAAVGAGFLVLLFSRRLGPVDSALPVSPVYETDTSPD
jgi:hypothetical protein